MPVRELKEGEESMFFKRLLIFINKPKPSSEKPSEPQNNEPDESKDARSRACGPSPKESNR